MSASSGAGSSRKSGSTSTAPTTTSAPPNGQQQQVGGAVAPTKLPKEWAVADLLRTQTSLLKRLKNVATAGGSREWALSAKRENLGVDSCSPSQTSRSSSSRRFKPLSSMLVSLPRCWTADKWLLRAMILSHHPYSPLSSRTGRHGATRRASSLYL